MFRRLKESLREGRIEFGIRGAIVVAVIGTAVAILAAVAQS
jgi:hypothetical protein